MKARSLVSDSRGAIMVMGIFFCVILVGALWYIAGIGDAVVYRERAQEAADAVAFTSSAIHAHGMNLIVLLNLTMALILSIRVVLKAMLAVEIIAAIVFVFIAPEAEGIVADAITFTERAIDITRKPINLAIESLSKGQKVIADVIPAAAVLASTEVGVKYRPIVKGAIGAGQEEMRKLPVEEGEPSYLCKQAASAIPKILAELLNKAGLTVISFAAQWIGDRVGDLAKGDPEFFCELPGGSPPSGDSDFEQAAEKTCQEQADQHAANHEKFDEGKCVTDTENQEKSDQASKTHTGDETPAGEWSKMTPKKLIPGFGNGCAANESIGVAMGDRAKIAMDPKIVGLGRFGRKSSKALLELGELAGTIEGIIPESFTQAEFFYDCYGGWGQGACNEDGEDAMWHFNWRPRLILFNNTYTLFKGPADALEAAFIARTSVDVARAAASSSKHNDLLLLELEAYTAATGSYVH